MRIGIYPGSFDPLTSGHLDIIKRARILCDKLIVAIARNSAKSPLFSIQERKDMILRCCGDLDGVEFDTFEGLLVDYCKNNNVAIIFRGLRSSLDYEYEYAMSALNMKLAPGLETVFFMSRGEFSYVSSNIVKEVAGYKGDVTSLVPPLVADKLREKFSVSG